ncbi:MAG: hypothetical protein KF737_15785, partial [Phenylobacterium sp.]|nr:hypothetical protein [Phenylobacterium sp.]
MTAPSLNTVSTATPGAAQAAGAKPGQAAGGAGDPRAGFDALLAALFPNTPPDAQAATAPLFAPAADGKLAAGAKGDEAAGQDADPEAATADADVATDTQGLAACLLATPQPTVEALLTAKAPPGDGRPGLVQAGKGAPGRFALPGRTELAPDAADAGEDAADALPHPTPSLPAAVAKAPESAPPAWARATAPAALAQP